MKNLKLILLIIVALVFVSAKAVNVQTETIYFKSNASIIEKVESKKLLDIADANQFYLIGHTDADGDIEFNQELSKRRVNEVYDFLISKGISSDKISKEYFGESKPLNKNVSMQEKAENRRVEIKYLKDPLMDFEVEKQTFEISGNEELLIKGKEGTEILIPANAFAEKNVKIELKEFYKPLDILSANLSTRSGEKLLETSGMIYMEAFANGNKVEPKKDLTLKFVKMNKKEDFSLFEGNVNKNNLETNWTLSGEAVILDAEIGESEIEIVDESLSNWTFSWTTDNLKVRVNSWDDFFERESAMKLNKKGCFRSDITIKYDNNSKVDREKTTIEADNKECEDLIRTMLLDQSKDVAFRNTEIDLSLNLFYLGLNSISDLYDAIDSNSYDESAVYSEEDSARRAKVQEEYKEQIVQYETDAIVMGTANLGWINCDRYIRVNPKTNFVVEVSDKMNVRMIVEEYNSFFNASWNPNNENKQVFKGLPLGKKVKLICTSYKDGEILLAIEETNISKTPFKNFNFTKVTKEELKKRIESL